MVLIIYIYVILNRINTANIHRKIYVLTGNTNVDSQLRTQN